RATHATLDLVEDEQQPPIVAQPAQGAQKRRLGRAYASFALHGLDQDARRLRADRLGHGLQVAERYLVEAIDLRPETLQILLLAAGSDGGQGAPVKGAFERDQAIALRRAVHEMMASGHLDGTLDRLGARIAEEHRIGAGCRDAA